MQTIELFRVHSPLCLFTDVIESLAPTTIAISPPNVNKNSPWPLPVRLQIIKPVTDGKTYLFSVEFGTRFYNMNFFS